MARVNTKLTFRIKQLWHIALAGVALGFVPAPLFAQDSQFVPQTLGERASFADLTTLSQASDLVIRAEIRRQITVEPERSPGLAPGFVRLYIEARTISLIAGSSPLGEEFNYLLDVPLDNRGKAPKLKKREVILFADTVAGNRGFVQLVGENAQLDYSPELESRLRPILTALVSPDRPPVVTGVRDALAVPGTLAGESETQIFLETQDRSPVSITVLRRPRRQPVWGVSWGEIIDSSARPPEMNTLEWFRLACTLPAALPDRANLARDPAARRLAQSDYALVVERLGHCTRVITQP